MWWTFLRTNLRMFERRYFSKKTTRRLQMHIQATTEPHNHQCPCPMRLSQSSLTTHCLTLVLQPCLCFPYPLCLSLRHLLLLACHHSSVTSSSSSLASLPSLSSSWHLELARHRLPTPLPPRFCTPPPLRSFGPQHNTPRRNATLQTCSLQGPNRLYRHGPVWSSAAGCLWVYPFARGATLKSAIPSVLQDPPRPPPGTRAGQGDREGPPHPHARAHNTWIADPNSPPSGRAVGGGGAPEPRRPSQQ